MSFHIPIPLIPIPLFLILVDLFLKHTTISLQLKITHRTDGSIDSIVFMLFVHQLL